MSQKQVQKVFVSFCRDEPRLSHVRLVVDKLRNRGLNDDLEFVMDEAGGAGQRHGFDNSNNELNSATTRTKAIIDGADVFVLFISDTYKNCKHCFNEATYIFNNRTSFVPVKMLANLDGWIGFSVAGKLYIEFEEPKDDKNLEASVDFAVDNVLLRIYGYLEKKKNSNGSEEHYRSQRIALTTDLQKREVGKARDRRSRTFDEEEQEPLKENGRISCSSRPSDFVPSEHVEEPNVLIAFHYLYNPEQILEMYSELAKYNLCVVKGDGQAYGSAWTNVAKEVDKADVVLVVFSDGFKRSRLCREGILYAKQKGAIIIPVRHEPGCIVDGWLEVVFGDVEPIDFVKGQLQITVEKIVHRIGDALRPPMNIKHRRLVNQPRRGSVDRGSSSDDWVMISESPCLFGVESNVPKIYVIHCLTERAGEIRSVLDILKDRSDLCFQLGKQSNVPTEMDRGAIATMIEECDLAIFFLNSETVSCRIMCRREIEYVLARKKRYLVVELDEGCSHNGVQGILAVGKAPIQFTAGHSVVTTSLEILRQIYGHLEDQGCSHSYVCHMKEYYSEKRLAVQKEIWALAAQQTQTPTDAGDENWLTQRIGRSATVTLPDQIKLKDSNDSIMVFLSYSWAVKPEAVLEISNQLQHNKYDVWIDRKDMGTSINHSMADGIERSDVVVIFFSQEYSESPATKKEAHYALDRNVRIIPVVMQKDHPLSGWLAVRLNQKEAAIVFDTVEQTTKEIIDRIDTWMNKRLIKFNLPQPPIGYQSNSRAYETVKEFVGNLCNLETDSFKTLLVYGKRNSGKTSLITHLLGSQDNEDFLLNDCHVRYVAWLNVKELSEIADPAQRRLALVQSLGVVCRRTLNIPVLGESFAAINSAISNATEDGCRFLLGLDNVETADILESLLQLSRAVRCIAISSALTSESVDPMSVWSSFDVALGKADTVIQLKTLLKRQQSLDAVRLEQLADYCRDSPLLLSLLQARLDADENSGQSLLTTLTSTDKTDLSLKNVVTMILDFYFDSNKIKSDDEEEAAPVVTRDRYFSLLIFNPGQPFDIKDAACLLEMWDDKPKIYAACNSLKKVTLLKVLRENKDELVFYIDDTVHEVAVDYASKFGYPTGLAELRQKLITPAALRNAVKGMRGKLLNTIISELSPETLARLCSDQCTIDGKTFLHILYLNRDYWRQFVGTGSSSEKSVALEFFIKIIQRLHGAGIDVVKILTLSDKSGHCLLLDIRENKSEQPELLRLAQMVDSYGGYRLRPACYEKRIWLLLEKKLKGTAANLLIQATLANDLETARSLATNHPERVNEKCEPSSETALSAASSKGFSEIAEMLIKAGANVNVTNTDGVTPLMKASVTGSLEIVKLLHENGATIATKDKNGNTAIILAAVGGHLEIIQYLVEKGADLSGNNRKGMNVLFFASQNGFENIVDFVLKQGGKPLNNTVSLAFWHAAQNGHMTIANKLLQNKAKIELNSRLPPVLTKAALNGHRDMVKMLFERGVRVDVRDANDFTSLMHAVRHGNLGVVQVLVEAGAKVNAKNMNGTTALFYAAQYGYLDIAKYLVSKKAEVDARNNVGRTPLMRAVEADQPEIVDFLVQQAGANIQTKENSGYTALMIAASIGNSEMIHLLVRHGAQVNTTNASYQTPLMLAARYGSYAAVSALLQCGAAVDQLDRGLCSALHYAQMGTSKEHYSIIQLLKSASSSLQGQQKRRRPSLEDMLLDQYESIHPTRGHINSDAMTDTLAPPSSAGHQPLEERQSRNSLTPIAEQDF